MYVYVRMYVYVHLCICIFMYVHVCILGLQIFAKKLPGRPSRFWTGTRPEISIIFSVSISKQGYLTIKHTLCLPQKLSTGFSITPIRAFYALKIYLNRPNV